MNSIPDNEKRLTGANEVGKKMYGENYQRIIAGMKELDPVFADFVHEIPYGSVFVRDGASLRDREISAITALTCLNLKTQLKSHVIAGMKVGLTEIEIREILLNISQYIGYPLVTEAFKVLKDVLDSQK